MDIKDRFPIFKNNPELIYLDNAATTQRLDEVSDVLDKFNRKGNATIHRGVYDLSAQATREFENVRKKVAHFIGSDNPETIAFTKGTTESINVVSHSFAKHRLKAGDNVVVTLMEHHANFVPWQRLCKEIGCELRVAALTEDGTLDIDDYKQLVDKRTGMVAVAHISNVLGVVNPIEQLIDIAHANGSPVLIDAAQSAAFYDLDVKTLNYDFLTFSAHKMFGPFGIGVLYTNPDYINEMKPYSLGGGIIQSVSIDKITFRPYPHNLDAGTPNVSGVLGLGEAVDFLVDFNRIEGKEYINRLTRKCIAELIQIKGVEIIGGTENERSGIIAFNLEGIHPHDVASYLNGDGIAVRAGFHCAQPLHQSLNTPSTVRISFSIYNAENEIDRLIKSIKSLIEFWNQ